ncbi:MAG: hypothetical protein SFU25_05900 [Candidatus Caenarcaniphilales bacterium]|nr:hypothetical protein [Candidatus Caenarcaniphilales bacterium]
MQSILLAFQRSLLGEIYPEVRGICFLYSESQEMIIRYYLDREPTSKDYESIEVLADNILSDLEPGIVSSISLECNYSDAPINQLEQLTKFVYIRREYQEV